VDVSNVDASSLEIQFDDGSAGASGSSTADVGYTYAEDLIVETVNDTAFAFGSNASHALQVSRVGSNESITITPTAGEPVLNVQEAELDFYDTTGAIESQPKVEIKYQTDQGNTEYTDINISVSGNQSLFIGGDNPFGVYRVSVVDANTSSVIAETGTERVAIGYEGSLSQNATSGDIEVTLPRDEHVNDSWYVEYSVHGDNGTVPTTPVENTAGANNFSATIDAAVVPSGEYSHGFTIYENETDRNGKRILYAFGVNDLTIESNATSGAGSDGSTTLVVDSDGSTKYQRLSTAVADASAGDTIEVHPGTYREQITLDTNVTLVAPDGATLNGSTFGETGSAITITGDAEPMISGFTIRHYDAYGIAAANTTGNWVVNDTTIVGTNGFEGTAINAEGTDGAWQLTNVEVLDTYRNALNARQSTGDWEATLLRVNNTTFGDPIRADESTGDWVIQFSEITNSSGQFGSGVAPFESTGNWTIRNTTISDHASHGVDALEASGDWEIRGSVIANNSGDGVKAGTTRTGAAATGSWTISKTLILANGDAGVDAEYVEGMWSVRESTLAQNGVGIDATNASKRGNATYNYWGATDGPSGDFNGSGDAATGNLSVMPYYTDSARTTLSDAQSNTSESVTVVTTGSTGRPGGMVMLRAEATNTGDEPINLNHTVNVPVKDVTTIEAYEGSWTNVTFSNESMLSWQVDSLGAGETATAEIELSVSEDSRPTQYTLPAGTYVNGELTDEHRYIMTITDTSNMTMTVGNATAEPGDQVVVPVATSPVTGGVYYAGNVSYNPSVLSVANVSMNGVEEEVFVSTERDAQNGTVGFSVESSDYIEDPVVNVTFDVISDGANTSPVNVSDRAVFTIAENYEDYPVSNGTVSIVGDGDSDNGTDSPSTTENVSLYVETPSDPVRVGDTALVELVAGGVNDSVGAYEATVSVPTDAGVEVKNVTVVGSPSGSEVTLTDNNTTANIAAYGMETADGPSPDLAEITLTVTDNGSTTDETTVPIRVQDVAVSDSLGNDLTVDFVQNGTLRTTALPPVGDLQEPPTDVDGDGLYEDVNGDGNVTVSDVQALFANRDHSTVENNRAKFDYSGNGVFNIVDIQHLFLKTTA
ncbi:right-handed parallel beta-helix repeat-containing protein, partial [Haloferax profundi]